ncbi:VOC family virulence protein [Hahella sp. CCB-MM4]|nr:VOC family virulence protein [Hahella sp. CCB-MM4]
MIVTHLDHLVLTVKDIENTCDFYSRILGMEVVTFGDNRRALRFGEQKINLHSSQSPLRPHARVPMSGSADLCFISTTPVEDLKLFIEQQGVIIEEGPVPRTGATGAIRSIYFRDPDGNLIEVSNYVDAAIG